MGKPALIIIDMQNDFVLKGKTLRVQAAVEIIPAIQKVLDQFRKHSLPIFHIVRIHRPDGSDVELFRQDLFRNNPFAVEGSHGAAVVDELVPQSGEYLLPKIRMSAFIGTGLDLTLRTLRVGEICVCGIQTPNCVRTTVFDAMAYNYKVSLIDDATGAQTEEIHRSNVRDMENIGVGIIRSDMVESLLTGYQVP